MQISRVPLTALALLVLSAAGAAPQLGDGGAAPDPTGATGSTATIGTTDASGQTGATDSTSTDGATGSSGSSGSTGSGDATGASGPTGASTDTGSSGATGASTLPSGGTAPTGSTAAGGTTSPATTSTGPTGSTGTTALTGPSGVTGPRPPLGAITAITPQPQTGNDLLKSTAGKSGGTSVSYAGGALAPSPSLFSQGNPLSGVLPGSVFDPLVNAAIGADVPQWYVDHFNVPAFLLPIYQSAGAAYGVPWEVLAAINQVETNFGSDLNVSSAGAVGWMQFLPSTWTGYGVDATGSGVADPYNAADAIFSAARYLSAAGAATDLPGAIFTYNHSTAYVQSVLLRAELLSGVPSTLVNTVSELSEGLFPIELRYHPSYRSVQRGGNSQGGTAALAAGGGGKAPSPANVGAAAKNAGTVRSTPAADIFARPHAAAVAVADGTVIGIGHSPTVGTFVRLRDGFGNTYTYGNLSAVAAYHLTVRPEQPSATSSLATPSELASGPAPTAAASAGDQASGGGASPAAAAAEPASTRTLTTTSSAATASPFAAFDFRPGLTDDATIFGGPRLPSRSAATQALGAQQERKLVNRYYTSSLAMPRDQLVPKRLRVGSHVLAGTILGYLGADSLGGEPHLIFQLRPAGPVEAAIDPRPFLDAWTQLATLELHRKPLSEPLYGPSLHTSDAGQALRMSQIDLERVILQDRRVKLSLCEHRAIADGDVDRRVLASVEFLVENALDPKISGAQCAADGIPTASAAITNAYSVTITQINDLPVASAPAPGSPTDSTIRALLTLTGASAPAQLAGPVAIPGAATSIADPTDSSQIVVTFKPAPAQLTLATTASVAARFALGPKRWKQLDEHLLAIPQPRVPTSVSGQAVAAKPRAARGKRS